MIFPQPTNHHQRQLRKIVRCCAATGRLSRPPQHCISKFDIPCSTFCGSDHHRTACFQTFVFRICFGFRASNVPPSVLRNKKIPVAYCLSANRRRGPAQPQIVQEALNEITTSMLTTHNSQLKAQSSQLKAHNSQLTAHCSLLTAPLNSQQLLDTLSLAKHRLTLTAPILFPASQNTYALHRSPNSLQKNSDTSKNPSNKLLGHAHAHTRSHPTPEKPTEPDAHVPTPPMS